MSMSKYPLDIYLLRSITYKKREAILNVVEKKEDH